jgi:hypothetical protein
MTEANAREPAPYSDERVTYRKLIEALHLAVHEREGIEPAHAIFAIFNLGVDVAIASGALWASGDFIESLHKLVTHLEGRKADEPAPPLLTTLKETLASARPKFSH